MLCPLIAVGGEMAPDPCIAEVIHDLQQSWPHNHTVNLVAFGHSVPAGYGVTPRVQKRAAYPRLLEDALAVQYPNAVLNVITEAVGGENSTQGRARLQRDVLGHHPRVVLIDYGLNDRGLPLAESRGNLVEILAAVRSAGACPVLLTPTWDTSASIDAPNDGLNQQAGMIRSLAKSESVPLADSLEGFTRYTGNRELLMAQANHPNAAGHAIVLKQLLPLFDASNYRKATRIVP